MDFTSAYRHTSSLSALPSASTSSSPYQHCGLASLSFSPGSTFLAAASRDLLIVRATRSMQVVRTWKCPADIQQLQWSPDGMYILVRCSGVPIPPVSEDDSTNLKRSARGGTVTTRSGSARTNAATGKAKEADTRAVAFIYGLQLGMESSEEEGAWVARIDAGPEGMSHAEWAGGGDGRTVVCLSEHGLRLSIWSLASSSSTHIQSPKHLSSWSYHPTTASLALLQRSAGKDFLSIYTPPTMDEAMQALALSLSRRSWEQSTTDERAWKLERSIPLPTTSATSLAWSSTGSHLAIYDHNLEYRLLLLNPAGHLLSTFVIASSNAEPTAMLPSLNSTTLAGSSSSSTASRGASTRSADLRASRSTGSAGRTGGVTEKDAASRGESVSGGGLGVRAVRWHPSGRFLAVASWEDKICILESSTWKQAFVLDCPAKVTAHTKQSGGVAPTVRREPRGWVEESGGRGVVHYEPSTLPTILHSVRPDSTKPNARMGVSWLEWSADGTLLAVKCETKPTALFIYRFHHTPIPPPSSASDEDENDLVERPPQPHLLTVLIHSSPIRTVSWSPDPDAAPWDTVGARRRPSRLAWCTGTGAVYVWSDDGEGKEGAEGIGVPVAGFSTLSLAWSPDGRTLLLADREAFSCAFIVGTDEAGGV